MTITSRSGGAGAGGTLGDTATVVSGQPVHTGPKRWAGTMRSLVEDRRVRTAGDITAAVLLFYFVQQWFWPAPLGVLVRGVLIGGLTALVAFGISLIYRANRVINFAQGDLGGVPASLAVLLIVSRHWPYLVAVVAGLAAAVALGAFVELTFV